MTDITPVSRKLAWSRVMTLAAAAFIFNTTEYIPVGLLSNIGDSFGMPSSQVGIMLTVYAWIVALTSLPMMLMTSSMNRRHLLIGIFTLFTASHVLSFFAWNFDVLLISRVGVALAHALFWSITASLVFNLAPPGRQARALSLLATATALASVLGLPLGRLIGQVFSWRGTFMAIGMGAFALLWLIVKMMPDFTSASTGSAKSLPALLRRPALVGIYALTVVAVTAHFTAFTYIESFTLKVGGFDESFATVLLFVLGSAGVIGSIIFSKYAEMRISGLITGALFTLSVCLLLLYPFAFSHLGMIVLSLLWGASFMIIGMGMQMKVLKLASDATDVAMAIASGIINIGIGAGALLGNRISSDMTISAVGYVGGALAGLAFIGAVLLFRKSGKAAVEAGTTITEL